jgi:hypothetical protein
MKKLFQIGLLMLLFAMVLAVVPPRSGPTYQDAGIQCISTMDHLITPVVIQDQPVVAAIGLSKDEVISPYLVALRHGDVEKSLTTFNSNVLGCSQGFLSPMYSIMNSGYMEPNQFMGTSRQLYRGRYRLDIGEITSQHGVTCRHI